MTQTQEIQHPWHGVSYGNNAPESVNAIIEIPKGSRTKYEIDKMSGLLCLDRILHTDIAYPVNYGFIPQTYGDDKDPLDILVFCSEQLLSLSIVPARVIGGMSMIDKGFVDDKIIAVAMHDPMLELIHDLNDMLDYDLQIIKAFFQTYKKPEHGIVEVKDFFSRKQAFEVINTSIEMYRTIRR